MATKRDSATDAMEVLHRRFFEGKPDRLKDLDQVSSLF